MSDSTKTTDDGVIQESRCSACTALVEEDQKFCTGCGAQFEGTAGEESTEVVECVGCGLQGIAEDTEDCPRCGEGLVQEAKSDDDEDEDDDPDADPDDDEEGDDDGDDKKKVLLDKGKKKNEAILSPVDEARVLMDIATALHEEGNERGLKQLAAHTVWGERNEDQDIDDHAALAETAPGWVPEAAKEDWKNTVLSGRPRTMMGAIAAFKGVIASR